MTDRIGRIAAGGQVRAVFMGSDAFSLPVLDALVTGGPLLPVPVVTVGVVTQPDRPAGRGRTLRPNPVKTRAVALGLPVLTPERVRDPDAMEAVTDLAPAVIVVAAYGQILPRALLDVPPASCLNLHPSLLPRLRGPSPVAGSILAGDSVTGTTLMLMAPKMDAGPILAQTETTIGDEETAGELEARLAAMSASLLLASLPLWLAGSLPATPQDDELATYTGKLTREQARVDWSLPAVTLARQVRAYNPWPVAHTTWRDEPVRLLRAVAASGSGPPGRVLAVEGTSLLAGCGDGVLVIERLQLAGGRPMPAAEAVRGHSELLGADFV